MSQSTRLSFDDLLRDVIGKGLCNRCGACVSFCTADRIGAIEMCNCIGNLPRYADSDRCFRCGICYLICPQTQNLNEDVRAEFGWSAPVGVHRDVVSARATDPGITDVAADGGVVTALLAYMLENKVIDGAIVAKRTGLFKREPEVATTREGLIQAAGSGFAEPSRLEGIGEKYSTYMSVLPVVRMFGSKRTARLAVVGTPCQIMAVRKMQVLNIMPADTIRFTVGLFCMQCFAFENLMGKMFVKKYRIRPEDIRKLNVKEDFRLEMKSGVTIHVPFEEIEDIARPACLSCRDFAGDFADISAGGLGSPDGYTTAVIRTTLAERVFSEAVNHGYVQPAALSGTDKKVILSLIESTAEKKKVRAAGRFRRPGSSYAAGESNGEMHEQEIDSAGVPGADDLCGECEKLNRHLTWVVGFVSHELSASIGTIIMNMSALADPEVARRLDKERRDRMLTGALSSLNLLQDMVRNYLASSTVRTGRLPFTPRPIAVADVVDGVALRLKSSFRAKGMKFVCDRLDGIEVICDRALVRVALNNLVQNAIKYGTPGTTIRSTLREWKDGFEFAITNEGVGIPEDKFEAVFDEYVRFDTLGVSGTGLGLFLVRKIAAMHDGSITVDAGYVLDGRFVTYRELRENPTRHDVDPDDTETRRFTVFTLRIRNCASVGSGSDKEGGNQNG